MKRVLELRGLKGTIEIFRREIEEQPAADDTGSTITVEL